MEGVVVGCDANQEWLLPWWWEHYSIYNRYPVLFIDFGMTPQGIAYCQERGSYLPLGTIPLIEKPIEDSKRAIWEEHYSSALWDQRMICFKKPFALLLSPFSFSLWLDLDCQVQKSLEPMFNSLFWGADIAICKERESVQKLHQEKGFLQPHEVNYNSGVILLRKGAPVLQTWAKEVELHNDQHIFDQQALSRVLSLSNTPLIELPPLFNWSRAQGSNPEAYIQHFHGGILKQLIRNDLSF
jgi:hypothetical protein